MESTSVLIFGTGDPAIWERICLVSPSLRAEPMEQRNAVVIPTQNSGSDGTRLPATPHVLLRARNAVAQGGPTSVNIWRLDHSRTVLGALSISL